MEYELVLGVLEMLGMLAVVALVILVAVGCAHRLNEVTREIAIHTRAISRINARLEDTVGLPYAYDEIDEIQEMREKGLL